MAATEENQQKYYLLPDRSHRYLRITENDSSITTRNNPESNVHKFQEIQDILKDFDFSEEQIETIYKLLAAILLLGEMKFKKGTSNIAEIDDGSELVETIASLLDVDAKKFGWSLTNYCVVNKGVAVRKRQTCDQARSSRDVLANNLYSRLVDYIVSFVNYKLSFGRIIL